MNDGVFDTNFLTGQEEGREHVDTSLPAISDILGTDFYKNADKATRQRVWANYGKQIGRDTTRERRLVGFNYDIEHSVLESSRLSAQKLKKLYLEIIDELETGSITHEKAESKWLHEAKLIQAEAITAGKNQIVSDRDQVIENINSKLSLEGQIATMCRSYQISNGLVIGTIFFIVFLICLYKKINSSAS